MFLFGVGRFLCEGFQYDCEYHFEKAWLGEAGKRLLFLSFKENWHGKNYLQGQRYYSTKEWKRYTGWLKSGGNWRYYNRKNGIMFRNRWATGTKYIISISEVWQLPTAGWLTEEKRYYFLPNSRMATGWQKIGEYRYYFDKKTGALYTNVWV